MADSRQLKSLALLLAMTALFLVGAYCAFEAGERKAAERKYPTFAAESIIALKDGSTMVAEQGTLGREMVDWLNDNAAGEAQFLLAGQPFVVGSTDPTPESELRIGRFVAMLKASRDVTARIIVLADGQADLQLASARAERLGREIMSDGISEDRMAVEGRQRSSMPDRSDGGLAFRGGQVAIVLTRKP